MSGIFGILNFDGQPVAHKNLEAMLAGMAYWGFGASSFWQGENVGIGRLLLHNPPVAGAESLPLQHPTGGLVLTAQARIDNRDDLWPVIASRTEAKQSPDSELIAHAYLRWGEECVQHLTGDWAFAAWDPREHKLFLARDHCGISNIYYCRQPHFFAFASSIKGLLALPDVPKRPNLQSLARLLTVWAGDGENDREQTAYEEIFRLPAAHTLTITPDKVEMRRYWHLENTPPLRLGSDDEYLEAFLDVYREAVCCRLRTSASPAWGERKVGATLSGGLDSGSVCALAARELRSCGGRLPVFTSVPMFATQSTTPPGWFGDESPLVEINRRYIGNLDVHYIRAEAFSPLAGMRRALEVHDRPMHAAGNEYWLNALLETARQQGLGILLTGQVGNATISWGGTAENPRSSDLSGQWQILCRKLIRSRSSPWKMVRQHVLRPIVARTQRVFRSAAPWEAYSAIHPQWARSLDLRRRMKASGHDPYFMQPSDPHQARFQMLSFADGVAGIWEEMGRAYGLEVRDPTMDKRLMEFCLAIPDEQYRLNGQDRSLIRRAMQGLLPDEVRLNRRRGLQAADLGYRLLAELPEVQAMLTRLEQSTLACQVLDLAKMKGVLQALQKEVNARTTATCEMILARGMLAGMFLLRFDG